MLKKKTLAVVTTTMLCCSVVVSSIALAGTHRIQTGDSLFTIARTYGTTVTALKQANSLTNDIIYAGNTLTIPEGTTPSGASIYTVVAGDTLSEIAQTYGVTVANLKSWNQLSGTAIAVGQTLQIYGSTSNEARTTTVAATMTTSRNSAHYVTQAELDLLAHVIYGEARGESYQGQVAVAAVVLNRVRSAEFPNTIKEVIFQKGAFTAVSDGQFYLTPNSTAYQAAREAINGYDPTGGATYYWNPVTATSTWVWSRPIVTQIDKHVFAT